MTVVETYRGMVAAQECDHLGHMNIQFYVARVSDAAWRVMGAVGFTPAYAKAQRLSVVAARQEIDYHAELVAGDLIHMRSGVIDIGQKSLIFLHRLRNSDTGAVAMTSKIVGVCMSLDARQSVALPSEIRAAAAMLVTEDDP